jgi:DNA-directed RNA polymerase subunit L
LNENKDVEYSNYFTGHPGLDDPELYLRAKKGKDASKILKAISADIAKEFSTIKLS